LQIGELRSYLRSKGVDISEENSSEGLITDLAKVIEATDIIFKDATLPEAELEMVINSIVSLILILPLENNEGLIIALCEKVVKTEAADRRNSARIRSLNNLFHGIDERCMHRYIVYMYMLKLAATADMMHKVNSDLVEIKKWVAKWDISTLKYQQLLRTLYEALDATKNIEKATKVMVELLSTYTEDNASQAREDAQKCIVTCLADSNTFLMDHLLTLKPVKFLEGEPIHDLLTIFVSGKLSQYENFYPKHKDFVASLGLSHEDNMQKMRILTMMQMAETKSEIDFETIQQEMKIEEEDVEAFIIDIVRTKAIRAKMDQMQRKVIISSTTHRTFSKQQWQTLREHLDQWQHNLNLIMGSLDTVANMRPQHSQAH